MDQAGKFKVNVAAAMIIAVMIALSLIYLVASDEFEFHWGHQEPELVLDCALPAERPMMDAPTIVLPMVNDSNAARTYASTLFPRFNWTGFPVDYEDGAGRNATYSFGIGDGYIRISGDGAVEYSVGDSQWTEVDEKDFPLEVARACSTAFIDDHGGLGPYEETDSFAGGSLGEHGLEAVTFRSFEYHQRYNGYLIFGYDCILTSVSPIGPMVSHCVFRERQYGAVSDSRQVIPSEEAWWAARNVTFASSEQEIRISRVELCYYYPGPWESPTALHPAWRFVGDHIDIFVDAFTGIVID